MQSTQPATQQSMISQIIWPEGEKTPSKELHSLPNWQTCDGEEGHQDVRQSDVEKHCPASPLAKSVSVQNIKYSETDTFLLNVKEKDEVCFEILNCN